MHLIRAYFVNAKDAEKSEGYIENEAMALFYPLLLSF